jgi:hypothetical protein
MMLILEIHLKIKTQETWKLDLIMMIDYIVNVMHKNLIF